MESTKCTTAHPAAISAQNRDPSPRGTTVSYGPFDTRDLNRHATFGSEGARESAFPRSPGASYELSAHALGGSLDPQGTLSVAFFDDEGQKLASMPVPKNGVVRVDPELHPTAKSFGLEVSEGQHAKFRLKESGATGTRSLPAMKIKNNPTAAYDDPAEGFRARTTGSMDLDPNSTVEYSATGRPYDERNQPVPYQRLKAEVFDPSSGKVIANVPFGDDGRLVLDGGAYPKGSVVGLSAELETYGGRVKTEIRPKIPATRPGASDDRFERTSGGPSPMRTSAPSEPAAVTSESSPELLREVSIRRLIYT